MSHFSPTPDSMSGFISKKQGEPVPGTPKPLEPWTQKKKRTGRGENADPQLHGALLYPLGLSGTPTQVPVPHHCSGVIVAQPADGGLARLLPLPHRCLFSYLLNLYSEALTHG